MKGGWDQNFLQPNVARQNPIRPLGRSNQLLVVTFPAELRAVKIVCCYRSAIAYVAL